MPNNVGVKMSMDGYDVKTAPENKLVFTSKYKALKIHSQGSGSHLFTEVGGDVSLSTHDLGYRPFFIVWVNTPLSATKEVTTVEEFYDLWEIYYIGTATETVLNIVNANTWMGDPMWDTYTSLPDRTITYDWIIFYDPIKDV